MPSEIDLAWAAGFFDGEGTTSCGKQNLLVLSASQKDRRVLDKFKSIFGVGQVRGPFRKFFIVQYHYSAGYKDTVQIMNLILPYLGVIKREQYQIALSTFKLKWPHYRKDGSIRKPKAVRDRLKIVSSL